jgi:hypothetical protein
VDAVDVEEFAKAVEVQFLPELDLLWRKAAATDFNHGRTKTFPIAD